MPKQSDRILYTDRVNLPGLSDSQIRRYVRQWLALDHFPIQPREIVSDSLFTNDFIVACSFMPPKMYTKGGGLIATPVVNYTLVIDFRNGGYRAQVGNFTIGKSVVTHRGIVVTGERLEYYNASPVNHITAYLGRIDEEVNRQLSSLKTYLEQASR
ncbi:hypothetical protein ACFSUS_10440 [Spirosoma soli]|uniref:DUF4468 domain-containing protein n=1 Tax=Spirosoma soli TaxID=1770529 RepID=A0ABW5M1X3_9BACT